LLRQKVSVTSDVGGALRFYCESIDILPQSSSATFCWSPAGTAVVVTAISDVDASNKSYYGEQKLHFLSADGQIEQAVPLQKEGPVHDVQWDPS
jgi:translation initiation factor 2A